ncbi:hypothetical protein CDAR_480261 [Caerostris darwini]|uniref:Uncharacterized protein n=1 Tax=Caerostris darwini TaxID=1538125 RepID=A0AAV4V0J5_9ARAC|nr:hypothetical protein CDAR_480261 [Caerostris darwini]
MHNLINNPFLYNNRFLHHARKLLQVCSNLFSDEYSLCSIKSPFRRKRRSLCPNKSLSCKEARNVCLHLAPCVFIPGKIVRGHISDWPINLAPPNTLWKSRRLRPLKIVMGW